MFRQCSNSGIENELALEQVCQSLGSAVARPGGVVGVRSGVMRDGGGGQVGDGGRPPDPRGWKQVVP